jgi:hypothetical protein
VGDLRDVVQNVLLSNLYRIRGLAKGAGGAVRLCIIDVCKGILDFE